MCSITQWITITFHKWEKNHKGTRDCHLCYGKGHGENECPCLNRFGKPLASKDSRSRQDLAMHLIDPTFYPNHYRTEGDKRIVFDNMPKIIPALVIHKRYIIDQNITNVTCASNLCCECTLLREGGNIEHGQHRVLYHIRDISSYVTRRQDNLVVCLCYGV